MVRLAASLIVALFLAFSCVFSASAKRSHTVDVRGGSITVQFDEGKLNLTDEQVLDWVKRCSDGIVLYFGKFPLKKTLLKITPSNDKGVGYSTATSDGDRGLIEVPLGRYTTKEDLDDDWILTHEMVHLNFPLMAGNKAWIAEGMAVYVEPFARVQAGNLPTEKAWGELMRDLPQGLPGKRDRGLDHTPTWERTYWGGALFYFVADLEIRKRTNNAKGLQDAFRAITRAGGNICSDWSAEKCFEIGDKEIGVPVLQGLYEQMRKAPVAVDLPQVWKLMGVQKDGQRTVLNRSAPLARTRDLISAGTGKGSTRTQ
jgi:hypothetical protein